MTMMPEVDPVIKERWCTLKALIHAMDRIMNGYAMQDLDKEQLLRIAGILNGEAKEDDEWLATSYFKALNFRGESIKNYLAGCLPFRIVKVDFDMIRMCLQKSLDNLGG